MREFINKYDMIYTCVRDTKVSANHMVASKGMNKSNEQQLSLQTTMQSHQNRNTNTQYAQSASYQELRVKVMDCKLYYISYHAAYAHCETMQYMTRTPRHERTAKDI
eukprot:698029_1